MKTPHKHAELIKAWADGAEIQYREHRTECWRDCYLNNPAWDVQGTEYRIKPTTIRYRIALFQTNTQFAISTSTEIEAKSWEKTNKFFVRWLTDWIEVEV